MGNAYSTSDLLKGALQFAGENTDGSSSYHSLALKYMNHVYLAVLEGSNEWGLDLSEPWSWARCENPLTLILKPVYDTGTVTMVNGATSGHSFSASVAQSQAGRWLKVNDRATFYRIATHTAGATAFTTDGVYVEESGSGLSYKSIPIVYDLGAGILRLVEPMRHYETDGTSLSNVSTQDSGKILGLELNKFRQEFPLWDIQEGVPTRFATKRKNDDSWSVEFNRYPAAEMKVDVDVIDIPEGLIDSTDSIPLIPRGFRALLESGAAHFLCIDKEDGEKATYYFNLTKMKIAAMQKANRKELTHAGSGKGQLFPRQDQMGYRRLYR